jgi:hypothetical protein
VKPILSIYSIYDESKKDYIDCGDYIDNGDNIDSKNHSYSKTLKSWKKLAKRRGYIFLYLRENLCGKGRLGGSRALRNESLFS